MTSKQNSRLAKAEIRKETYVGEWATSLSGAIAADTGCEFSPLAACNFQIPQNTSLLPSPTNPTVCCLSLCCPWCVSYHLRRRALRGDWTRFLCCNGDWPCSGRCGEQRSPQLCLALVRK